MASSRCSKFCSRAIVLSSIIVIVNTWLGLADYLVEDENCDQLGILFYEDIGCTPKFKEGKWCPTGFDCSNLTRLSNVCRLRGKLYKPEESADYLIEGHACQAACICRRRPHAPADFLCGILDCPEWMGASPLKPGCHRKYDLHKCCSAGTICDGNIPICKYRGKGYLDGEIIQLKKYCVKCICQDGFSIENPSKKYCSRHRCGLQLRYADKIEKYCAPTYLAIDGDEKICCPNSFICPSEADEIRDTQQSNEGQCKFGDKTYNFEATFNRTMEVYFKTRNFRCDCKLPPFFTCLEQT